MGVNSAQEKQQGTPWIKVYIYACSLRGLMIAHACARPRETRWSAVFALAYLANERITKISHLGTTASESLCAKHAMASF